MAEKNTGPSGAPNQGREKRGTGGQCIGWLRARRRRRRGLGGRGFHTNFLPPSEFRRNSLLTCGEFRRFCFRLFTHRCRRTRASVESSRESKATELAQRTGRLYRLSTQGAESSQLLAVGTGALSPEAGEPEGQTSENGRARVSRAAAAAACSAFFLLRPVAWPIRRPSRRHSTVKRLSWSGPVSSVRV